MDDRFVDKFTSYDGRPMGQKGPNGKRRIGCGCQLLPRRVNRRARAVGAAKLGELRWRDLEPGQGRCYARAVSRNI